MKSRILFVVFLCLVGVAAMPQAQKRRQKVAPIPAPNGAVPKIEAVVQQFEELDVLSQTPIWRVDVDWGLTLNQGDLALYQQAASVLTSVSAIPNDRLNYYAAITVNNWTGLVTDVQPDGNGGYIVTATVDPLMDSTEYGSSGSMLSDYSETYAIAIDGSVTYLGFHDPNGWAGLATEFAFD
jgi:hypothetical protein